MSKELEDYYKVQLIGGLGLLAFLLIVGLIIKLLK